MTSARLLSSCVCLGALLFAPGCDSADPLSDDGGPVGDIDAGQVADVDAGPVARSCTTLPAALGAVGAGGEEGVFVIGSTTTDRGLGGSAPDVLTVEFYDAEGFPSGPEAGSFDLSTNGDENYATCRRCVALYVDFDGESWAHTLYPSGGTMNVVTDGGRPVPALEFTELSLIEVTIDTSTFQSTPVDGGLCAGATGSSTTQCTASCGGRVCGSDGCGGTCGTACTGGSQCRSSGSQCDPVPAADSLWTITAGSGTVDERRWDPPTNQPEPDANICFELNPDTLCSGESSDTYTPSWNVAFPSVTAQALLDGIGYTYNDEDTSFDSPDVICEAGVMRATPENFALGTLTVSCASGSFTVTIAPASGG